MRLLSMFFVFFLVLKFTGMAQTNEEQEKSYTKVITERAEKIVTPLGIPDTVLSNQVHDIIVAQYRNLNEIYTVRDTKIEAAKKLKETNNALSAEQIKNVENEVYAQLYILHFDYISKLQVLLSPEQVDQVKDGMTYNVLNVTYKGYLDMIPSLTEIQKRQIWVWLNEAREHAMDAGSSKEKHAWFGKFKGRINNYLSKEGYNLQDERAAWEKRIEESKK